MTIVDTGSDEIRRIEAAAAPSRFARGWHCLGLIREFADGEPHAIEAFGTKLVVFAGADGSLNVLDAYCRHMGGDLSAGQVKGDQIACPFHDWRWGGDGRCKQIPYARRVPPLARTRAWPTLEQDGMLFVWNDPEGKPPPAEVTIPRIEGAGTGEWTDWHWYSTVISSNCREIVDNVVDMAHFFYIHGSLPTFFKNVFEGHTATQYFEGAARADLPGPEGKPPLLGTLSVAAYHGPSFMIDDLTYQYADGDLNTVLLNCHYPIDSNSFVLQYGIMVRKSTGVSEEEAMATAVSLGDWVKLGFEQDVQIWKNKATVDNPLLCEEDGPVYQLRRWYQQFYIDVADIAPEMVNRFEFEIDTTRPTQSWNEEVRRNVERAAAR
ncbi:MAG: putative oxygenase [Nocardia sp.]|uniref:Rieske 2Fe-2S domain-containing protein n=1 Tax=Nocardia sp. TaxID=1821 RepID=UPI0026165657|nr:Rieske 2Fe-2S domain-containing protein [Nocardia sp.]MCU1644987.1 putative oxygenase [Nocardia sp.]